MTRSKDIGTAHTTAVIRYLRDNGFPHAELRNQAGALDKGDIVGCPGLCWEAKGGFAAETASDGQVSMWLRETEIERRNAKADIGVLVMKRKAIGARNAGRYWAVLPFWAVIAAPPDGPVSWAPVRMHLADAVTALREQGYGEPL